MNTDDAITSHIRHMRQVTLRDSITAVCAQLPILLMHLNRSINTGAACDQGYYFEEVANEAIAMANDVRLAVSNHTILRADDPALLVNDEDDQEDEEIPL